MHGVTTLLKVGRRDPVFAAKNGPPVHFIRPNWDPWSIFRQSVYFLRDRASLKVFPIRYETGHNRANMEYEKQKYIIHVVKK